MATVTGMTAAAMQAIRDGTVVSAAINGAGHLILTTHNGTQIDAGLAKGADGAVGPAGPAGPSTLASGTQITWGADVNLYRQAADVLKTDDAFVAALGYSLGAPLAAPAYQAQQIAAQTVIRNKLLAADANDAFHILGSGKQEWGAGGASAVDTNLYRSAAATLKTDGAFLSGLNIIANSGNTGQTKTGDVGPSSQPGVLLGLSGDTNLYRSAAGSLTTDGKLTAALGFVAPAISGIAYSSQQIAVNKILRNMLAGTDTVEAFSILGDGKHQWGPGGATAIDTTLYRSNPGVLKTDGYVRIGQNVVTNVGASAQVGVGDMGPASQAGFNFGSASDANLYRSAAGTLKTDGNLIVGGNLTITGSITGGYSPTSISIPAIAGTPAYAAAQVAAETVLRNKLLAADANDAFHILGSGKQEWGAGGASAVDVWLQRNAADQLKISGSGAYDVLLGKVSGRQGISLATDTFITRAGAGWVEVAGDLSLDNSGHYFKWVSGIEQTTVGAAGGASALPATPTKYLKVKDSAGTVLVIPAYAAA